MYSHEYSSLTNGTTCSLTNGTTSSQTKGNDGNDGDDRWWGISAVIRLIDRFIYFFIYSAYTMVNTKNIIRTKRERSMMISIRIPESMSKFMKKKNYSPTSIFVETMKELGWKPE